jgi:SH3-like domain-containing protein
MLLAGSLAVRAAEAVSPVPRFASFASDKVYMREGPTYRHPILWVYRRRGLPVEILAQYDVWRRVRDADGTIGWVHASMIAERRTVLVTAKAPSPVRRSSDPRSPILALAQAGLVAKLEACEASACEIEASGAEGWIDKKNIWGVRVGETFR